jgi:hypothetical protein
MKYEIQGKKIEQRPLKIRQIRDFIKLVASLDLGEDKKTLQDVKANEIIDLMLSDKVKEAASILFGEKAKAINWDEVEYETIEEIVNDFLSLNPNLAKRLRSLFGFFDSMSVPAGSTPSSKSTAKK